MPAINRSAYKITNVLGVPTVQLYGYIGNGENINAQQFMADFDAATANSDTVNFEINCGGGSVIEGFAILDMIATRSKKISCTVFGMAASMGFVLMLAATEKITMAPNARLLTHRVSLNTSGDADALARNAVLCQEYEDKIIAMTIARTGLDDATVRNWFASGVDKWFTAAEALANNIIDEILPSPTPTKAPTNIATNTATDPADAWAVYNTYQSPLNNDAFMTKEELQMLGLTEGATALEISNAIKAMRDENAALKAAQLTAKTEMVNTILDNAVARKQIKAEDKTNYQEFGMINPKGLTAMLDGLPSASAAAPPPPKGSLRDAIDKGKNPQPQNEDRSRWSWTDYAKKDPAALQAMTDEQQLEVQNRY